MTDVKIPTPLLYVVEKLEAAGFEAYVVGGAVRDILLKKGGIKDWDITTGATPEQVLGLISESFYDNAFGTVMVAPKHVVAQMKGEGIDIDWSEEELNSWDVFDITTFRSEGGYSDRRRPDVVEWGKSLEEDVARRDFTINAMALKMQKAKGKDASYAEASAGKQNDKEKFKNYLECEVELIDYFEGKRDLQNKLIRTVGDPQERFDEDALRMMRAIRFGAELSFSIAEGTLSAIKEKAALIKEISGERVRDELLKIMASPYPADGIKLMYTSGLLEQVLPELLEAVDVPQGGHHIYDVWNHMVESLRECPARDPMVRLATLLHDIGKPRTMRRQGPRGVTFYGHEVVGARLAAQIADRLRLSKKQKARLVMLVRWHMFTYDPKMTDAAIRRFIRRVGRENINDMMMLRVGDRKGGGSRATSWRLRELQERIGENLYEPMGVGDLVIDGNELMQALDIKPGPKVGKILNQLFEEVMEDKLPNEKEKLLERTKELARASV